MSNEYFSSNFSLKRFLTKNAANISFAIQINQRENSFSAINSWNETFSDHYAANMVANLKYVCTLAIFMDLQWWRYRYGNQNVFFIQVQQIRPPPLADAHTMRNLHSDFKFKQMPWSNLAGRKTKSKPRRFERGRGGVWIKTNHIEITDIKTKTITQHKMLNFH